MSPARQIEQVTYSSGSVSMPVTLILLLLGSVIFLFGHRYARMQRTNADLKATHAAVKTLRKGFWSLLWQVVKVGALLLVAGIVMTAWIVHDLHANAEVSRPPPANVSPAPPRTHH